MIKIIGLVSVLCFGSYFLFRDLLQQSKKPTGLLGITMMKLWNGVYLPMVSWALASLAEFPPDQVLDIGVGNGASTNYLAKQYPSATITGIDISEVAVTQARKRYSNPAITFSLADIQQSDFDDESFSLICAFQTHFHWQNKEQAFRELHRILRKDGTLIIASEYAKIKYFLPEIAEDSAFSIFLLSHDLVLKSSQRTKEWVSYQVKRNN